MHETSVSIMPLVEDRDYWKRRALIAEANFQNALDARADKRFCIGIDRNWKDVLETQLTQSPLKVIQALAPTLGYQLLMDGWARLELDSKGRISLCVDVVPGSGMSPETMVKTIKTLLNE